MIHYKIVDIAFYCNLPLIVQFYSDFLFQIGKSEFRTSDGQHNHLHTELYYSSYSVENHSHKPKTKRVLVRFLVAPQYLQILLKKRDC